MVVANHRRRSHHASVHVINRVDIPDSKILAVAVVVEDEDKLDNDNHNHNGDDDEAESEVQDDMSKTCIECGEYDVEPGAKFCPMCGTTL